MLQASSTSMPSRIKVRMRCVRLSIISLITALYRAGPLHSVLDHAFAGAARRCERRCGGACRNVMNRLAANSITCAHFDDCRHRQHAP